MSHLALLAFLPSLFLQAAPTPYSSEKARTIVEAAPAAMKGISASAIEKQVRYLTSKELEGRLTGTAGQKKAAAWFQKQFESFGLEPLGDKDEDGNHSWYQNYPVTLYGIKDESGLFDPEGKRICQAGGWFNLRRLLATQKTLDVQGKLAFAGRWPALRHVDDEDQEDLEGRIAVYAIEMPKLGKRFRKMVGVYRAMFLMGKFNPLVNGAARHAKKAGALGCIVLLEEYSPVFQTLANTMGLCRGTPLVLRGHKDRLRGGGMGFGGGGGSPLFLAGGKDAKDILKRLGLRRELVFGEKESEERGPRGVLSRKEVRLLALPFKKWTEASNTVGILRGSEDGGDEAVIFSCHMDHNGRSFDGGAFWGADDNGSGSGTVLEIARAFSKLKKTERPKHSVIFLAVSGEEKGLWGSAWFVKHPTWPIDNTLADINMDMVGRSTAKVPHNAIAVTPTNRMSKYSSLVRDAVFLGQAFDLEFKNGDKFYARSDHFNFARQGIPILFFCDDEHPDYHMVTDTPEKLEYGKLEKLARLSFLIGYRVATGDLHPERLGRQPSWFVEKQ
jgi:Peptidase family M28